MGALYEDVEKFFGDIFAAYGRFVARFPIPFVVVPVVGCCLMSLGLLNMSFEFNMEKLYAPLDSQAMQDRRIIADLYDTFQHDDYFPYQEIDRPAYVTIAATAKRTDAISVDGLAEIATLVEYIRTNITARADGYVIKYGDVCTRRNGKCTVEGIESLKILMSCYRERMQPGYQKRTARNVPTTYREQHTNKTLPNHCVFPPKMKLQFNLKQDRENFTYSLPWQESFLSAVERYLPQMEDVNITYKASQSLDILLKTSQGHEAKLFIVTVAIMFVYVTVLSFGGDWVSTHMILAHMTVVSTLMSIVAAFGTIAMFGIPFVKMCTVMPFMVLGSGVDHMLLLLSAWRLTNTRATIEERTAETFRACAISTTIMSLTDLLVYCIGSASQFRSVRYFCATSGVALLYCYINQLTFFGGCLVLNARRMAASRHCVTCLPTKSREELEEEQAHRLKVICCSGSPPRKHTDNSLCRKGPKTLLRKDCLRGITKSVVFLLYIAYVCLGFLGFSRLEVGFRNEDVVPGRSHLTDYIEMQDTHFVENGPPVMFVFYKNVPYDKSEIQRNIYSVLNSALAHRYIDPSRHIMWLDDYIPYAQGLSNSSDNRGFIGGINEEFYNLYPQYRGDVVVDRSKNTIPTSRFYVFSMVTQNASAERSLLLGLRRLAHNTTLPLLVYSSRFVFSEHHINILKGTLLTVAVTIISMLLIALMFIPHPVAVTCVTVSMVSVVLGMLGSLYFLGLTLNAVQTLQVLIGVGLCLNFTTHICHSFMAATGQSRNERVSVALEKVGGVLIYGAMSYFLGFSMLIFGSSYLFLSFFKCLTVAILVGLLHATVFLPVLLSFLGPRRTFKPRLFAAASPSVHNFDPEPRLSNSAIPGAKGRRSISLSRARADSVTTTVAPRKFSVVRDCSEPLREELEPVELDAGALQMQAQTSYTIYEDPDEPPPHPPPPPPIDEETETETEQSDSKPTSPLSLDLQPIDL